MSWCSNRNIEAETATKKNSTVIFRFLTTTSLNWFLVRGFPLIAGNQVFSRGSVFTECLLSHQSYNNTKPASETAVILSMLSCNESYSLKGVNENTNGYFPSIQLVLHHFTDYRTLNGFLNQELGVVGHLYW